MRVRPEDTLAGFSILRIRAALRKWGGDRCSPGLFERELGISTEDARLVMTVLEGEGFVSRYEPDHRERGEWFELTVKGSALAGASAAKPLRRVTVERKLIELVNRMVHVNKKPEFLVGIESAYVYGSYLRATESLSDLDISLTFYRKETNGASFAELSRRAARRSGRRFNSFLEELFWPERQVLLFLKQRSRVYSLHIDEPLLRDQSVQRRAIIRERRPVAV